MNSRAQPTLFGYPTGLFNLFFAEMWERFSYYGMRALLVFYMIKGFLGYNDGEAYKVYGAYTALVYMTPFFGGLLADRLLGARRAVVFGGLLMAAGHLLMTWEVSGAFFVALALLIVGNGFFKPNISTIVGGLYEDGDPRRDAGFTLFYIGINLGAAMAPLLCGYVGETYGWHYGFGLATLGMMVGLAVFVVPNVVAQGLIAVACLVTAIAMVIVPEGALLLAVNGFVALALLASGACAFVALGRGGLDKESGAPKDPELLKRPVLGFLPLEYAVYLGTALSVPVLAAMVWSSRTVSVVPEAVLESFAASESAMTRLAGNLLHEVSSPPGLLLLVVGIIAIIYLLIEAFRSVRIERDRMFAVLIMMFFSMLFWALFEQAGSSVSIFTDRNVDRVSEQSILTDADVGQVIELEINQEQLGYPIGDPTLKPLVLEHLEAIHAKKIQDLTGDDLAEVVEEHERTMGAFMEEDRLTMTSYDVLNELKELDRSYTITAGHVGMGVNGTIVPASTFQSANAIYIMILGLFFSATWTFLGQRNMEPSTPLKFSLALLQLGLGFAAMWYGATIADDRGMVSMFWILLGYLLHTTGELCLSPVGLSMVTRLSPARLVSTVMGAWFLATAFSNYLAAIIAAATGIGEGSGGGFIPVPLETVDIYGGLFGQIALAAIASGVLMGVLTPLLKMLMHEGESIEAD